MFTHRWAILRSAIPMGVSVMKTVALVIALAKLHNFCIDENEAQALPSHARDELWTEMRGGIPLEGTRTTNTAGGTRAVVPCQLIDGDRHFVDIDGPSPMAVEYANTGLKLLHYIKSCLVILYITWLLKQIWHVQCSQAIVVNNPRSISYYVFEMIVLVVVW